MKYLLFILLIGTNIFCDAAPSITTIKGHNKDYAGEIIRVYKFVDFITKKQEIVAYDTVNKNGDFLLTFHQFETLLITVPLGIYNTIIFTEPGKTYEVVLPPLQPKTKADILNPFHHQVEVYLGVKNVDSLDLNLQVADFNDIFNKYIDSHQYIIFNKPNASIIDSVIDVIDHKFTNNDNLFFENYRKYKYAILKNATYMSDSRYVIREYYHEAPFLYQNPTYMDLFNQLFANYISYYMKTSEGERLFSDIAYAKSPQHAKETFSNNMVLLNDTLQELVLLKGIHDAFYQKAIPISSLIITLDSLMCCSNIDYHKTIAENIKHKVLKAKQGFDAPKFELSDAEGKIITSDSLFSAFTYLNFISIESFVCLQDFEILKSFHENHKSDFKIVSICIDDDFERIKKHFNENGYDWTLLNYGLQKNIISDYNVKAYPSYYLVNPNGKLSLSPALSPRENFELSFFNIFRDFEKRNKN